MKKKKSGAHQPRERSQLFLYTYFIGTQLNPILQKGFRILYFCKEKTINYYLLLVLIPTKLYNTLISECLSECPDFRIKVKHEK